MKIAVTCENDQVFQHFGHTPQFAIFDAVDGEITSDSRIDTGDSGHGALATLLSAQNVEVLICGGIGGGAINALARENILVVGGAEGNVRQVAEDFANGRLKVRANFHCNHHDHGEGHTCGDHGCGSNKCH